MPERKPPDASFESWTEVQIRSAQERGDFDNLPDSGKPLSGLDRPRGELDWVAKKIRDEDGSVSALLPESLALRKEIEDLPRRVERERSEERVREIVRDLNERIRVAHQQPQVGPPLRATPVDVEEVVQAWREALSGR